MRRSKALFDRRLGHCWYFPDALSRPAPPAAFHLAAHHRLPTIYTNRVFPDAGGLMSYGTDLLEAYRASGRYVGRILKGEKAADLPVEAADQI